MDPWCGGMPPGAAAAKRRRRPLARGEHARPSRNGSSEPSLSEALDPRSAQVPAAYCLVSSGKAKKFGTRDDKAVALASATYESSSHTVALTPRGKLPGQALPPKFTASGVNDATGRPIDRRRPRRPARRLRDGVFLTW